MKRLRWIGGVVVGLTIGFGPPRAEAVIVINEVLADPPAASGDANHDGVVSATQDEFIELANTGADSVSLAAWSLSDAIQARHVFSPASSIPGYGFAVVFGGGTPQGFANATVASTGGLSLNNSGDTVTLFNNASSSIAVFTYGSEGGRDVSLTRAPDGNGPFVLHSSVSSRLFSPGTTADGLTSLPHSNSDPIADPVRPPPIPADPALPEPSSLFLAGIMGTLLFSKRSQDPPNFMTTGHIHAPTIESEHLAHVP